ncbi:MAG: twin-arginine translocase TatA/TatE family subunit [Eggerthellaceae bacterium]|nr:twin-arginine translocase TatA/TatE family subunit [Eggerthellaceae bacterium]
MRFLGMGVPELLIVLLVALLIFGPKNLPKLGKALGKSVKNLRKGMDENLKEAEDEEDAKKKEARASKKKDEKVVEAKAEYVSKDEKQ